MPSNVPDRGQETAFRNIGRFFCAFSELEAELNRAVSFVFQLQDHPAGEAVSAQLDIARKIDLVRAAVRSATTANGVDLPENWKLDADDALAKIHRINSDKRVPFAHGRLQALGSGEIRIIRITARGGQLKLHEDFIDDARMEAVLREIMECKLGIELLTRRLRTIVVQVNGFAPIAVGGGSVTVMTSTTSSVSEEPGSP
ncbi:hypothetical protein [Sinorhizobium meliloti]|uniref:hypothetical protein n=1 Tax=Rhizobium meliloti TaxID=382 RepID=UPI000FE00E82|nr:hypothetical protein [Sinorhizobium meliloti]RVG68527.1 hypothetical protein CN222_08430 [Sinorhizobium meliloti]